MKDYASIATEIIESEVNNAIEKRMDKEKSDFISKGKTPKEKARRSKYCNNYVHTPTVSLDFEESPLFSSIKDRRSMIQKGTNANLIHGRLKENDPNSGIIAGEYLPNKKQAPNIKSYILAKIDKKTGETESIIDLGGALQGALPVFSIDEAGGKFYLISKRKIKCISF